MTATIEDVTRIIPATCVRCGAAGQIYPYPEGEGSMFCPNCSPAWLKSFLEFGTKRLEAELHTRAKLARAKPKRKPLSTEEQEAVNWARAAYGRTWRKRFRVTREEHNARKPRGINPEIWDSWYEAPYGRIVWNAHTRILRRLQIEKRLP